MNKAKCGNCGDIIESKYRHDWASCSCYSNTPDNKGIFLDGGDEYFRGGGKLSNLLIFDEISNEFKPFGGVNV